MVIEKQLRLVGNQIVLGESTFCSQPELVATLHSKETHNRDLLKKILEVANAALYRPAVPLPQPIVELREDLVPIDPSALPED